ncbi:Major fimbrial subunit SMF-1 [Stenotrophomonas lactitubi]|nr:Major fimbrial subunit SMF-1 [Stenotrophomonas lactitubi]CAH0259261.1 Major fimbrial subunit SMF-1 [Stenotrophomonas lactitubi]CAH0260669.1 Major fimbrial subunit SMF-1 [Stenotrophomonas lactitubi]CAH0273701.1 Major fimbrial subunit SMF-1 [Stenotrophomonas lactitubi]
MIILAPLSANAADGTVTFNGKVTDKTCTISTPGGKDFSVTLPTVSVNVVRDEDGSGRTPFSINLTNCSPGNVATYFEPGPSVEPGTGQLLNLSEGSANGASNIQLRLRGSNNEILRVLASGAGQVQNNSQWVTVAGDGTANLNYYVEYIDAHSYVLATPGEVTSNVKYTIIYN